MNNQLLTESLKLTKKSLMVFLLGSLLYIATILTPKFSILPVIVLFYYEAFILSVPILLTQTQNNQRLSIKDYINPARNALLKSYLTLSAIYIIFILFTLLAAFMFLSPTSIITTEKIQQFILDYYVVITFFFLPIFIMFTALFAFTPIFFSLENKSLLKSIWSSVVFAIKNWRFSLIISLLFLLSYFTAVANKGATGYSLILQIVFLSISTNLIGLFTSSLCLIYWQKTKV